MQDTPVESNTLIRSFVTNIIHHSFHRAIKQIGLPDFPRQTFLLELGITHNTLEHDFPEDRASLLKLWYSIHQGEIIATEVWDEAPVFYVRGALGSLGVVLRLIYREQEWHVESVISTYHRPLQQIRWFRSVSLTVVVVLAALVGFLLHPPTASVVHTAALSKVTMNAPSTKVATPSHSNSKGILPKTRSAPPHIYAFTIRLGMPLFQLAQYLYDVHLIPDAMSFDMAMKKDGIDLDIQPGRYVFAKGMNRAQLLSRLKSGPSSTG